MTQFDKTAFVQQNNCEQINDLIQPFYITSKLNNIFKMIINWFSNMPHFMGSLCNRNKYKCLNVCICSKLLEATSVVFPIWAKNHCHYNITGDTLLLFNKCEYERKLTR